jgi:hypothetical protein
VGNSKNSYILYTVCYEPLSVNNEKDYCLFWIVRVIVKLQTIMSTPIFIKYHYKTEEIISRHDVSSNTVGNNQGGLMYLDGYNIIGDVLVNDRNNLTADDGC